MSFNVALSGIQAASGELGVVGNNIANASTVGFKQSRAEFADVYAAGSLGTSSLAIGNGVRLSAVTQSFTQGNINFSSKSLDLGINGQGFFKLNSGGAASYSRSGAFSTDNQGYIVNSTSQRLTGYLADSKGNITGAEGDLQIVTSNLEPTPTENIKLQVNLQATEVAPAIAWVGSPAFGDPAPSPDTYNNATSSTIYDSLGNSHIINTYFIKTTNANEWDVRVQVDGVDVDGAPAAAPFKQVFTSSGALDQANSDPINLSWSPLDSTGHANGATTPQKFNISIDNSTQFGAPFSTLMFTQDGATTGRLDNIQVDSSGIIFGSYSNGQSRAMGQVTLSNFANTNGLQPLGDTSWGETFASGNALIGEPGTSSLGLIQSGSLEDSNVDITDELVKMIIAQRNFQANAQTIRTEDATTQSIINIR